MLVHGNPWKDIVRNACALLGTVAFAHTAHRWLRVQVANYLCKGNYTAATSERDQASCEVHVVLTLIGRLACTSGGKLECCLRGLQRRHRYLVTKKHAPSLPRLPSPNSRHMLPAFLRSLPLHQTCLCHDGRSCTLPDPVCRNRIAPELPLPLTVSLKLRQSCQISDVTCSKPLSTPEPRSCRRLEWQFHWRSLGPSTQTSWPEPDLAILSTLGQASFVLRG